VASQRGSLLIVSYLSLSFLLVCVLALFQRSALELDASEQYIGTSQAFHFAEAGIDAAIARLHDAPPGAWDACSGAAQQHQDYRYAVACPDDATRRILSTGVATVNQGRIVERMVEVYGQRIPPEGLYGNAIYAARKLILKGNAYHIIGDVRAGHIGRIHNRRNIRGNIVEDRHVSPLPGLDFARLRAIAVAQGNYRDDWTGRFRDLPDTFWYKSGIPNVVYIDGDLALWQRFWLWL